MALSHPQQLEIRLKNIESIVEQRFASHELKINEFVEKLSNVLKKSRTRQSRSEGQVRHTRKEHG